MTQRLKATLGTSAITAGSQAGNFTVHSKDFKGNTRPTVVVDGLATDETATLWIRSGTGWNEVTNDAGEQVVYTATDSVDVLNGVGEFAFTKSASASALSIYLDTST